MLINSFSRNLPMIYLIVSLYAYNMNILFPIQTRNQFYLSVNGQTVKIGFIISEAIESAALYSGIDNDDKDINDTILASLQCIDMFLIGGTNTIQIPDTQAFDQVGGGSIIQKGGATKDDRDVQNKMIQDLYYNVTGIASSGISALLSTRLQLDDGSLIPVFDISNPAQRSVLNNINIQLGGENNYMQAFEILLILLTLEAKGLTMKLLSAAGQQGSLAQALSFLQSQGINDDLVAEARLLFEDGRLNNVIQFMATIQQDKLSELAFSMKAYSDQVKSIWGEGMGMIVSNDTFTYTPTFTDFILSTSFAISGNVSGNCELDIPFLYGIYYDGPLDNIADSSAFTTTSLDNSFPGAPQSPVPIATGLPSFMSLVSYANGSSQITMEQLQTLSQSLPQLYTFTVVDGNIGRAPLYNGHEALKASFMLYQLIKACYPGGTTSTGVVVPLGLPPAQNPADAYSKLKRLNDYIGTYINDPSAYPTIPVALSMTSSRSQSCYFISPAFKTLQTLSLIGSLLNIDQNAALANANDNINTILQSNQVNDHRSSMIIRINEIFQGIQQLQQPLPKEQQTQILGEISNLIDMLNQMNGYNLVNPVTSQYYEPGKVDPQELQRQMTKDSNPIPPIPYPGDLTNIQEVLNIMAESCQPNKDGKGFNSQYVKKQIEQNYNASGMPLNFENDVLATIAFNKFDSQSKKRLAFYNYFYKPWVTVNWENAEDPILNLYRFILFYAVKGEELTAAFPNSIPAELSALMGLSGGKKSKTRKNRKKKRHTRRNRHDNKKNRTKYRRNMHKKYTKKYQY